MALESVFGTPPPIVGAANNHTLKHDGEKQRDAGMSDGSEAEKEEGEIEDGEIIDSQDEGAEAREAEPPEEDVPSSVPVPAPPLDLMGMLQRDLENGVEGGGIGPSKKKKKKKKKRKRPPSGQQQQGGEDGMDAGNDAMDTMAPLPPKPKKRKRYIDHDRIDDDFDDAWMTHGSSFQSRRSNSAELDSRLSQSPPLLPPKQRSPSKSPEPPGLYDSPPESSGDEYDGPYNCPPKRGNSYPRFGVSMSSANMEALGTRDPSKPPIMLSGGGDFRQQRNGTKKRRGGDKRGKGRSKGKRKEAPPRQICKFYLDGKCSKGPECTFSHDSPLSKKQELCKFYLNGFCAKSETCVYMHKEFPCKFFHTGAKCYSADKCKFSHDTLTDEFKHILQRHLDKEANPSDSDDSEDSRSPSPNGMHSRPSLLGSPPRQMMDSAAHEALKKIPSLFDIEVKPPQNIVPPPGGNPTQQQPVRPNFYSETMSSPGPGSGPRPGLLPFPTSSFDPDQNDFPFDEDEIVPGFGQPSVPQSGNGPRFGSPNCGQPFGGQHQSQGMEPQKTDPDARFPPADGRMYQGDDNKRPDYQRRQMHPNNKNPRQQSFNPVPWRNSPAGDAGFVVGNDDAEDWDKETSGQDDCAVKMPAAGDEWGKKAPANENWEGQAPNNSGYDWGSPAPAKNDWGRQAPVKNEYNWGNPAPVKNEYDWGNPAPVKNDRGRQAPMNNEYDWGNPAPVKNDRGRQAPTNNEYDWGNPAPVNNEYDWGNPAPVNNNRGRQAQGNNNWGRNASGNNNRGRNAPFNKSWGGKAPFNENWGRNAPVNNDWSGKNTPVKEDWDAVVMGEEDWDKETMEKENCVKQTPGKVEWNTPGKEDWNMPGKEEWNRPGKEDWNRPGKEDWNRQTVGTEDWDKEIMCKEDWDKETLGSSKGDMSQSSEGSESDTNKGFDKSILIPLHLPKKQRELFLRIQQQQRQAGLNRENADKGDGKEQEVKAEEEEEIWPQEDVKKEEENEEIEIKKAETDVWFSSDDDDEDQPLTDVLKKLQQVPIKKAETATAPPVYNIAQMLKSIGAGITPASDVKPPLITPDVNRDPRAQRIAELRDPRSTPRNVGIAAEVRDPRVRTRRDPRTLTSPALVNLPQFGDPRKLFPIETDKQRIVPVPQSPGPFQPEASVARPDVDSNLTVYDSIPYQLRAVTLSLPNYSSILAQMDPKLVQSDPRLRRRLVAQQRRTSTEVAQQRRPSTEIAQQRRPSIDSTFSEPRLKAPALFNMMAEPRVQVELEDFTKNNSNVPKIQLKETPTKVHDIDRIRDYITMEKSDKVREARKIEEFDKIWQSVKIEGFDKIWESSKNLEPITVQESIKVEKYDKIQMDTEKVLEPDEKPLESAEVEESETIEVEKSETIEVKKSESVKVQKSEGVKESMTKDEAGAPVSKTKREPEVASPDRTMQQSEPDMDTSMNGKYISLIELNDDSDSDDNDLVIIVPDANDVEPTKKEEVETNKSDESVVLGTKKVSKVSPKKVPKARACKRPPPKEQDDCVVTGVKLVVKKPKILTLKRKETMDYASPLDYGNANEDTKGKTEYTVNRVPKNAKSPKKTCAKGSPKTPKGNAKSSPKTPKSNAKSSPKTPKGNAKSSPKTPKGNAKNSPKTPKGNAKNSPKTPKDTVKSSSDTSNNSVKSSPETPKISATVSPDSLSRPAIPKLLITKIGKTVIKSTLVVPSNVPSPVVERTNSLSPAGDADRRPISPGQDCNDVNDDDNKCLKDIFMTIDPTASPFC